MRVGDCFGSVLAFACFVTACGDAASPPDRGLPAGARAPAQPTPSASAASSSPGPVIVGSNGTTPTSTSPAQTGSPTTPAAPLPSLFAEPVRTAPAAPLAGGTLLVTADGKTAVAADPDRNRVFLVDLATHAVRSLATEPGEELGRVAEGPNGSVFVVARRGGAVLAIDVTLGTLTARIPVCNAPRGLAYDAVQNRLYVACRSGRLVTLDAASGSVLSTLDLDADLRDVFLVNGSLVLTRFRSAEILELDATGAVRARQSPPSMGPGVASVAFRGVALPNGMLMLAHEIESGAPLGTGFGAYYGGSCAGGGVVQQALSLVSLGDGALPPASTSGAVVSKPNAAFSIASRSVVGALGPLDLAVSRDGRRIAVVASGNAWSVRGELPTLFLDSLDLSLGAPPAGFASNSCGGTQFSHHLPGEPVAVAFDAAGKYVVLSREPALLELEGDTFISLSDESHFDTGFAMFHLNTGGGISCASCHPEGGDDGHVWSFSGVGLRRSQALEAHVGERTPFHWSGDLPSFHDLFTEVMMKRMSLPVTPPDSHVQALADWLDGIPALAPADGLDPALVARGQVLFSDPVVGCAGCHSGPSYADDLKHDVGTGGSFVTPALLGVGLRAPLMHDGCASSLRARFGVCGGTAHGDVSNLSEADLDALVAFMRTL
jgi:DNA-binding beta-propeller fold protein YncE